MKKFVLLLCLLLFPLSAFAGGSLYWRDTEANLSGIGSPTTSDRAWVFDSAGDITPYYYSGSAWTVGQYAGKVVSNSKGATYTLGDDNAQEAYGGLIYATATFTLTLPAVATGMTFCVEVIGAYTVTIDPNASDGIILAHSAAARDTDGDAISNTSAATGDMICLHGDSASGWTTWGARGTWAAQ